MTILPLTYLGNTEYFAALLSGGCVIDLYENYVKQTYRNRCEIMTAGGTAPLTVNVVKGASIHKKAVRDMRIDYSKRWQHQHWNAIASAYRNSPFFEHYEELFAPFFAREYTFLADLNIGLTETILKILDRNARLEFSDGYIEAGSGDTDLRGHFTPRPQPHPSFTPPIYYQVFSDRHPFAPNLSTIDLIFCEGPHAAELLK